jgi:hypothetical protein
MTNLRKLKKERQLIKSRMKKVKMARKRPRKRVRKAAPQIPRLVTRATSI